MNKGNTRSDFYEQLYKSFIDYLAVDFFLSRNEEPPEKPDLLKHIHTSALDCEFIDYLMLNIHRLVFVENFSDEMKTAIGFHIQKNIDNKNIKKT
jgi:hypothetical protein